jgi:hypothetical protein
VFITSRRVADSWTRGGRCLAVAGACHELHAATGIESLDELIRLGDTSPGGLVAFVAKKERDGAPGALFDEGQPREGLSSVSRTAPRT